MRIFCLTRVEFSLVGSVQTDSSRMSPYSSDRGSSFTIKYSRLMGAFTFLDFVQPRSICEDFYFLLRAMRIYSTYWFVGNVCRMFSQMYAALRMFCGFCVRLCTYFAYVYGSCIRLCKDSAHIVRLLRTYTAYLLCKLCVFCVCIQIFMRVERLCVHIRLIFCDVRCGPSWRICYSGFFALLLSVQTLVICLKSQGSNLEASVKFFFRASCSLLLDRLEDPILRVPSISFSAQSARSYWTVSGIQSLGFRRVLFPCELLVLIGPSRGSDIEGFCQVICPKICFRFTVRSYLGGFLFILIEQYIPPSGVTLMCTMMLCGRYKCRYEGCFGCNDEILD